ncbi:DEAD/DEAH box helicase [candidate division KSB1 bacterium]|nr:DEAD/DEAH box helicase [candidate division KSB1 bacterium]
MPIKIDLENKKITLSVSELAAENPFQRSGESGSTLARMTAGRMIHEEHQREQQRAIDNYVREFSIDHPVSLNGYSILIQGRIDGLYEKNAETIVEEIKSVILPPAQFNALNEFTFTTYRNQLRLYCHFLHQIGYPRVKGYLIFINLIDKSKKAIPVEFDDDEVQAFLLQRLAHLIHQIEQEQLRLIRRLEYAAKLGFPYPEMRKYQDDIIKDVEFCLSRQSDLLISAPTGIGKTAAVIFPALKYAYANKLRLFYITSKTTQQIIAQQTLEKLCNPMIDLRGIILQAREKICLNDQVVCHEDFCPYAVDYGEKVMDDALFDTLLAKGIILPADVQKIAREKVICPFELALDLSLQVDVIVCDYNYVFDPGSYLRRFFFEKPFDDLILIIDEAHNLYQRGRDYYSPELNRDDVQSLMYFCELQRNPLFHKAKKILSDIDQLFRELEQQSGENKPQGAKSLVELELKRFSKIKDRLDGFMLEYLIYKKANALVNPNDPVDEFFYTFRLFENVLALQGEEFSTILDRSQDATRLKILCKDPANQLQKRLDGFYAVIAMSATLEPLAFYRDVLGFPADANHQSYPSPFPPGNQKIIVDPSVSTRFRDRPRSYEYIADAISSILTLKPGNYFAFFPSFDYLQKVQEVLYAMDSNVIAQERYMNDKARLQVLELLRDTTQNTLVLAVQGGIFAEGVDYSGEMLLGAFVIGPALPAFTFEQELLKSYYQETRGMGFEYAYLCPGMNRVIQSVGRVIRSESDVGVILLIGQRFATTYYNSLFPRYWYQSSPAELISTDPFNEVKRFWELH